MPTFVVKDYRDFVRACDRAGRETKKYVRDTFRQVGEPVRVDAAATVAGKSARSAAGMRTVVRVRGVAVEQSRRKTTGHHPEWGAWQMRHALTPALDRNEDETVLAFSRAIDRVCDHFERG